jgi:hypothetical protein
MPTKLPNFRQVWYSFPVRLLALHARNHLVIMGLWVFLGLLVTGQVGRHFGMHYLLLTPEYRGEVGFWSYFLTGAAFGAFVMIWHLTTYLLAADRFPFLATLSAPFTKFSVNNSLIPLTFLVTYLSAAIWFQVHDELVRTTDIGWNIGGFLLGTVGFVVVLAGYLYLTNKDIVTFLKPGQFVPRPGGRLLLTHQRIPTLQEIRYGATRWRVDTYLTEQMHVRLVRSVAHYDPDLLGRVFRQNHFNAVTVQVVAMVLLMLQGFFMENEWLRFPTSVSIFIGASMVMAAFGALTYWFRQWGTGVFLGLLLFINLLTGKGYLHYRNQAYGLDYQADKRPVYDYAALERLSADSLVQADKAATERILDQWLARQHNRSSSRKPKIIFVCVSGGGHRAALWTVRTLQQAATATDGRLLDGTVFISGASGGMLGASYWREVLLRQRSGEAVSVQDSSLLHDLGQDLLNPVAASLMANDLFFPVRTCAYSGVTYRKDRGYFFEKQLNDNLRGYMGRRLADYRLPEQQALIPLLVVSPYVINDGRRLLISPQGVSYLARPVENGRYSLGLEVDGVDFRRLFAAQQADSLQFSSALRMNCTFPYILPNPVLPTLPALEVMDAGARDNFGILATTRFIHTFRDWITAHTDGVVIVQIRCWNKIHQIAQADQKGVIDGLFTPAAAVGMLTILQDYDHDDRLVLLKDILAPDQLEVVRFTYRPVRKQREASLSFHLSQREKMDIADAWYLPENQASVRQLQRALRDY